MRKGVLVILIIILSTLSFVVVGKLALAAEAGFVGGTIKKVDHETKEIKDLEQQGYECTIIGHVIEIKPKVGGSVINKIKKMFIESTIFGIPPGVISKTKVMTLKSNQEVLAAFRGETSVTCVRVEPPDVRILTYPSIYLYGNSKK